MIPLPTATRLVAPEAQLAFLDSQSLPLATPLSALEAWNRVMAHPLPFMATAMRIRDMIASRFGVKRINGFSHRRVESVQPGARIDFFLVEETTPNCLVLTERDRHLDVMTCVTTTDGMLTITSSVVTHNLFGRIYMIPVAPAHRLIVRLMLKRLSRSLRVA